VNTPCAVAKYHPRRWTMIGCRTPARAGNRLGGGMAHLHRPNQRSMQQRAVIQIWPRRGRSMMVKPSSHRRAVAEVQRDACRPIMHGKPATDADSEGSSAPKLNLNGS
jgi:hypothetical protein